MATFLVVLRHLGGMSPFVSDIRQTIVPGRDTRDGPLPPLLLAMTLVTGVAADSSLAGGPGSRAGRRLIAVAAMLVGAVIGAALVLNGRVVYPLVIAVIVTAVAATASQMLARSSAPWLRAEQ